MLTILLLELVGRIVGGRWCTVVGRIVGGRWCTVVGRIVGGRWCTVGGRIVGGRWCTVGESGRLVGYWRIVPCVKRVDC